MKKYRAVGVIGVLGSLSTIAVFGTAFSFAFSACSDDGAIVVAPEDSGTPGQDSSGPPPVIGGGTDAATDPDNYVPPGCVVTSTPADDTCVIIEALGVFVSKKLGTALPNGGDGRLSTPFGSLQKGIAEAKRLNKRVYACAETYDEAVTLENGVSVFGYFNCDKQTWTVIAPPATTDGGPIPAGVRARIVSPTSPALKAAGIGIDTVVESVDIIAPNATAPSGSSIGLVARFSPKLVLSHVNVHAGTAMKGDDGVQGVQLPDSATKDGAAGHSPYWCHKPPGSCISSDPCEDLQCIADHSARPGGTNACGGVAGQAAGSGGNGGGGGHWLKTASTPCAFGYKDLNFRHASPGDARPETATTGMGGNVGEPVVNNNGACISQQTGGADGKNGSNGNNGSSSASGTITVEGFDPGHGVSGSNGTRGQGGGGGGGSFPTNQSSSYYVDGADYWGSSGSGGGAGGCAGLAGTAGKGGGASIGIVLYDSEIILRDCAVEASNGGAGGAGSLGSDPTPGGVAGPAYGTASIGTVGGNGGYGGLSGWSGNGAGGPSIGIATHGGPPIPVNTPDATFGAGGAGVPAIGTVKTIPASKAGVAAATFVF